MAAAQSAISMADVDPRAALPLAMAASRQAKEQADPAAAALAERAWGFSLLQRGEVEAAQKHLRRSIIFGQRAGSAALAGEARVKLAYVVAMRGRPSAALHEIDTAVQELDGTSAARARAQRAVILRDVGRLDEALDDFNAALPALRAASDDLGVARMLVNRGILYAQRYTFEAALRDLGEAEHLSGQLGRGLAVGIIAENLGYVETLRGDVPAALAHLDRAERLIGEHGGQLGPVFQDRAELLLSAGLATEARQEAQRAAEAYRHTRRQLRVPEARLLQADAAQAAEQFAVAAQHADRAATEFVRQRRGQWAALARLSALRARLAAGERCSSRHVAAVVSTLEASGWPAAAVEARLVAAAVADNAGRKAAAREHRVQASKAAHRRGPVALRARGWYAEGLVRLADDRPLAAMSALRAGLRLLDEHGTAMGATDLRVHSAAQRRELAAAGLRIALREGRLSRIFEWAERGRASRIDVRSARPPDDPLLVTMLAELRATAFEVRRGRAGGGRLAARQYQLERQIRDHTRLRRGTACTPTEPVSSAALGQALADRVMIEFVQVDGVLHGLSLADGRLRLRPLAPVAQVAELIERMPFALHRLASCATNPAGRAAALALLRHAAGALDTLLLAPFTEAAGRALVLVPTGDLHSLPWSVLPSCAGRPLVVSPSATLWHAGGAQPKVRGRSVAVGAGPHLPGARDEAHAVAAIHGVTALVEAAATVESVLTALSTATIVHIAAHGRLSADNPLFSELLLADGPLVVYDLERLAQVPDTVILGACDGGRSVVRSGDELLGLSTAFLSRGTSEVIASVMPIPDAQTAPLMVALHRRIAAGHPAAVALAAAQEELRDGDPAMLAAAAGFLCLGAHTEAPGRQNVQSNS